MEAHFEYDFTKVRVHSGESSALLAERLGASAFTAGEHVFFARGEYSDSTESGQRLLRHELAHVVQARGRHASVGDLPAPLTMKTSSAAERDAELWSRGARTPGLLSSTANASINPSLASRIIQAAEKRLARTTLEKVSKHVAQHAASIAGSAIHSVFKNPKKIRTLLRMAAREAAEVASRHGRAGIAVVEEAGIRITRQARGGGRFNLMIQKVFKNEIGTKGERILRMVINESGRIVTAFPEKSLAAIGLTAAGISALTESTARAGEAAQASVAHLEQRVKTRASKVELWEWVPYLGDLWGGSLNEGEGDLIQVDREVARTITETIADVESSEKRTLGSHQRQELEELIRAAIAAPLLANDADSQDDYSQDD